MDEIPGKANNLAIYPNPAHDHFTISGNLMHDGAATITISDLSGRIVSQYNKQFHSGAFQEDIDIHELTKGIYIIKLDADRKSESVKLIVR